MRYGRETMKKVWKIWMYALGSFNDEDTREYDNYVTLVRTGIVGVNLICAFLIMINIIIVWL